METPPTATAAGGTHPTGMHSCLLLISLFIFLVNAPKRPMINGSKLICMILKKTVRHKR